MINIGSVIEDAQQILTTTERTRYITLVCQGSPNLIGVTKITLLELERNQAQNTTSSLFDIFSIITEYNITTAQTKSIIEILCGYDKKRINSFNQRYKEYFDGDSTDSNLLSDSYQKIKEEGITEPEKLVGLTVKDYRLDSFHAKGSFGFVYVGSRIDGKLSHQKVAIKVVNPLIINTQSKDVIDREANIMSLLDHRYIISVMQIGVIDYYGIKLTCHIMEFIDGCNIKEAFPLSANNLVAKLKCFSRACEALENAHGKGLIHADIKPDNILVRYPKQKEQYQTLFSSIVMGIDTMDLDKSSHELEPVLLDFSVSPMNYAHYGIKDANNKGFDYFSPYSAPEQREKANVSTRTDIYSMGKLLHSLLINEEPTASGEFTLKPSQIIIGSDEERYTPFLCDLNDIVAKACAKAPEKRYSSMAHLIDDIYRFIHLLPIYSTSKNPIKRAKKSIYRNPKNTVMGIAFSAALLTSLNYNASSYIENKELIAHNKLSTAQIKLFNETIEQDDITDTLSDNYFRESLKNLLAHNTPHTDKKTHQIALSRLAEQAKKAKRYNSEQEIYASILQDKSNLTPNEVIKNKSRYLVALGRSGQIDKSSTLARNFIDDLPQKALLDVHVAGALIEVFDEVGRYLESDFDSEQSRLVLLGRIKKRHYGSLTNLQRSLLNFHIANEEYYSFYGDHLSTSIGHTEEYYQSQIVKKYKSTVWDINKAIKELESTDYQDEYKAKFLSLSARLNYELRNIETAQAQSAKAIEHILSVSPRSPEAGKAYLVDFSINRYIDLDRMLDSALKANRINLVSLSNNNEWLDSKYYTIEAFIISGKLSSAKDSLMRINSFININTLSPLGLDAIMASTLDYFNANGLDRADEDNKTLSKLAYDAASELHHLAPDIASDSSVMLAEISYLYFHGQLQPTHLMRYLNGHQSSGSITSRNHIYLATMAVAINDLETARLFTTFAEKTLQYNDFEGTNSIELMIDFTLLSNAYIALGENDLAFKAIERANTIFSTHKDNLKDSLYEVKINEVYDKFIQV